MPYCEDCGNKLSDGTCPNCQEELYIFENQYEDLPEKISDEFSDKINSQKKDKDNKKNEIRYSHNRI
jgi:uncharacterized Zn finger protein (UPF0148 family)